MRVLADRAAGVGDALIRTLHGDHAAALWSYALRLTGGDVGRAQDAVQEALLRAWRHPEAFDPTRGSTRGWLLRTVRNVLIDEWRSRQARPEVVTDEVPEVAGPDAAEAAVQSWLVAEALRRLSRPHREVLVECFYLGASVAEAADRLGVPPGTVKSRTHYALRALRLILEEMGVTA
ncbi:MAG TPA: sigma-70 family RNA polymerase sigma factor [Mycobacteriales bacterium]|nr:sigma-70 family RNA polymerase sigma factor [Mycobacteriales bacterium]